jgi:predicted glycoside hydrolase/deacetylase ChbG (UPF0249 family)
MASAPVKRLIVNADDFGRTPGVNAGILEAHLRGIVTSATAMVLEPSAAPGIREAAERAPRLSLGLHFALTGGGPPAAPVRDLPTLAPGGYFPRTRAQLPPAIPAEEILRELEAQIQLFQVLAGRLPTHLDSHHHVALHPSVGPVFANVALRARLPVRAASEDARRELRAAGVRTPDHFIERFYGEGVGFETLENVLANLPDGTTELMCHPGRADEALKRGSTYAEEREREIAILCDPRIRELIEAKAITLVGFDAV